MDPQVPQVNTPPVPEILPTAASTETPPVMPSVPQKKYKTLFFLVLGLLIIVITSFGAWTYKRFFADSVQPLPTASTSPTALSTAQPTTDPADNWKTYTNQDLAIKFNYKNDICDINMNYFPKGYADRQVLEAGCSPEPDYLYVISEITNINLLDWWAYPDSEEERQLSKFGETNEILFSGKKGIEITFKKDLNEDYYLKIILIHHLGRNYSIRVSHFGRNDLESQIEDQILSSFKFLE